ncbi:MAG: UbiA family prenyltransferase, partial [Streptomycetales bacterium]
MRLRGLLRASHPGPVLAVTAITTALAASAGRGPAGTLLVALTILSGQLSIGWGNDVLDRERDRAAGRRGKPVASGLVPPRTVAAGAALALVACVPLSFANGLQAGAAHLIAVGSAWAYDLGVKATPLSFIPYAVSFGLLPAVVTYGLPGHPAPPGWAVAVGALLGVAAHLTNVLPDIDGDLATGVRGLPQRLGARTARLAAMALLLAA